MKAKQIIPFNKRERPLIYVGRKKERCLTISEFYCDTIQGEGRYIGYPATFLRLKGCVMHCNFCDTAEVWKYGSPYTISELLDIMEAFNLHDKLRTQHLVITGGSPLLQQKPLMHLFHEFIERYGYKPFIEIENECVLMPENDLLEYVDCWNNSPKLASSGVAFAWRYNPDVIRYMSNIRNAWFKFVVSTEKDVEEIESMFLAPKLILREQVLLMPQGETREELAKNREAVIEMAIAHDVRYTTREHIVVWDKTVGI